MQPPPPIRLAVLISGSGTTLQNLIDQIAAGRLNAQIQLVIASRAGIVGITRAEAAKLPTTIVARSSFADRAAFSQAVFEAIDAAKVDLVCLAGWLSLLDVPDRWLGRIMNIHPSLLPKFGGVGMYGHRVHEAVLAAGESVSGCTVHYVDNTCDGGPIILQRRCPVLPNDTPTTLAARVFEQETIAYPEAIREHLYRSADETSVADVAGPWLETGAETSLIAHCRKNWNVPIRKLTNETLAMFLRQRVAMAAIRAEASRRIASGYNDHTEWYDGQLEEALREADR